MQSRYARLSFYELRVVAMLVARPFKSIQLLRVWEIKMVLHAMDLINPVLAVVSRKSKDKYKS
jgi:hypothetical protein